MPIPDLERRRVERALDQFCERVPAEIRHLLQYEYRFNGNAVILVERRPSFRDPAVFTELPVARFVYSPSIGGWSLRWRDRRIRWHRYEGFENRPTFGELLDEVKRDPTGIFFG
ncbi:MAG TPA: DUF3024 domain-containing protein [Longimicrobium sp.]|nr:DUF3024 domain-containing protein [Longimicrobium sp.]